MWIALPPVFGELLGSVFLLDGMECTAKFAGKEFIPVRCLRFRFPLIKSDNHDAGLNRFHVLSHHTRTGKLEMSLHGPEE